MEFQYVPVEQLRPADYNPRRDLGPDDAAYQRLAASIARFDCVEPIVWNRRTGHVVGGHQRLKVLKARCHETVPCVVVDLDEDDERVLNLALNRIHGEWDTEKLSRVVIELTKVPELSLDAAGFEPGEIADLVSLAEPPKFNLEPAEPDHAEVVELRVGSQLHLLPRDLYERLEAIARLLREQFETDNVVGLLTAAAETLEERWERGTESEPQMNADGRR